MVNFFRGIANELKRFERRVEAEAERVNKRYFGGGMREFEDRVEQYISQLERRLVWIPNNEEDDGSPVIRNADESNDNNTNDE